MAIQSTAILKLYTDVIESIFKFQVHSEVNPQLFNLQAQIGNWEMLGAWQSVDKNHIWDHHLRIHFPSTTY